MLALGDAPIARMAALAARQHGVVARRQLLGLGIPAATITHWVEAGHLDRVRRGVYAVGHRQSSQRARWMEAVLACREGSVLSHGPSGQLAGIVPRRERFALHVTLSAGSGGSPRGIVTHRPRSLDPVDCTVSHRIPTTTPTRTVWDLAMVLPALQTRRAFEQAEKLRTLSRPRLAALQAAAPCRSGAGVIAELLDDAPLPLDETRTWLEELLITICRERGVPLPLVNVPVLDYEVDFLWPAARFIVEADGADHLNPEQRDGDNERDAILGGRATSSAATPIGRCGAGPPWRGRSSRSSASGWRRL